MRIVVTGSIATDHLLTFPGRFAESILGEHLDQISLSFLTDGLVVRNGGVGANIALGLARLGRRPLLVGAAGTDFGDYRATLEAEGVDTRGVRVSDSDYTARFLCTTDTDQNQIASFYPGAMSEARLIGLASVAGRANGPSLVLIGPDDPEAMLAHTRVCREAGWPFAADPSQQLALLKGPDIRRLVDGAAYLFTNEYEHGLLIQKTGWGDQDVVSRVGCWVTTAGASGVRIDRAGRAPVTVPAVPAKGDLEPTGVGDGFRAGFVAGLATGLDLENAARLGCALATLVLEAAGPQAYEIDGPAFLDRVRDAYGPAAAEEIGARTLTGASARAIS